MAMRVTTSPRDGTQTASGIVLANASDIDHGATLDATLISSPSGTYGSLTAFQHRHRGLHLHAEQRHQRRGGAGAVPCQGETVSDSFNYTVVDQFGRDQHFDPHHHDHGHQRRTGSMAMRVTTSPRTATQTASGIVLANASDIDHGATLDATLISSASGTSGSLTAFNTDTGAYTYT
jgi:hypothetical protein